MEKFEIAERLVDYAVQAENYINNIDRRFERTVFECGPSGYVGCSVECRGAGLRRRSGCMEDIVKYLYSLGRKKDEMIIFLRPLILAFGLMRNTRSGHVIYYRLGRKLTVQEYATRFGYSRRHARRMYIKALTDLYNYVLRSGGKSLLNKFSE